MTERGVTESGVEDAALAWLEAGGWHVEHGPDIAPDMPAAEQRLAELEAAARPSARSRPQVEETQQQ